MVNIIQDFGYQKIIHGWDIYSAKSQVLSLLWILSETSENVKEYQGDIFSLRDWYSLDPQDKTILILLQLSLSLVALGAVGKFIIEISKLDQTWEVLIIDSNDLKNDEIIGKLDNLISAKYVISIKFRYLIDPNITTKLIEDSYNKWLKDDLNVADITLGKSEWQIKEMNRYLESQIEIYGDMSFILNMDDIDKRIDVLMCLYHFQKESLINFKWSDIDYKASTLLSPNLFEVYIKNIKSAIVSHTFEFDIEKDQLKYNGVYMRFGKKNLDFIRTFFDLLEDGQDYIQADEILVGIERGFENITGSEQYKAKRRYVYTPRKTVNDAIKKNTNLEDFFGLENGNIWLKYPKYIKLSKKL